MARLFSTMVVRVIFTVIAPSCGEATSKPLSVRMLECSGPVIWHTVPFIWFVLNAMVSVVEYSKMRTRMVMGSKVVKLAVVSSVGGAALSRLFSTTICKLSSGASHGFRVSTMRRTREPRTAATQ